MEGGNNVCISKVNKKGKSSNSNNNNNMCVCVCGNWLEEWARITFALLEILFSIPSETNIKIV